MSKRRASANRAAIMQAPHSLHATAALLSEQQIRILSELMQSLKRQRWMNLAAAAFFLVFAQAALGVAWAVPEGRGPMLTLFGVLALIGVLIAISTRRIARLIRSLSHALHGRQRHIWRGPLARIDVLNRSTLRYTVSGQALDFSHVFAHGAFLRQPLRPQFEHLQGLEVAVHGLDLGAHGWLLLEAHYLEPSTPQRWEAPASATSTRRAIRADIAVIIVIVAMTPFLLALMLFWAEDASDAVFFAFAGILLSVMTGAIFFLLPGLVRLRHRPRLRTLQGRVSEVFTTSGYKGMESRWYRVDGALYCPSMGTRVPLGQEVRIQWRDFAEDDPRIGSGDPVYVEFGPAQSLRQ